MIGNPLDVHLVALDVDCPSWHATVRAPAWPRLWGWLGELHGDILDRDVYVAGCLPVDESGVKLDAETCRRLADALDHDLASGAIDDARKMMSDEYASRDLIECGFCEGTGVRRDELGQAFRLDDVELDETTALVVGRDRGTCDVCDGYGRHPDPATLFTFERETVEAFAAFLRHCGGVGIV